MALSSNKLISCEDVAKTYFTETGPVMALKGVSLSLEDEDTMAIVGPSGCGKSTLLFILAGLEKPTEGCVRFRDAVLDKPRREVALVLQDYGLFPWKTVQANIELGLKIRREQVDVEKISALLHELGISEKTELYPQQLSGGQRQRVALARALVLNPSLLLLDEPFASLDALTRERLQDLVAAAWRSRRFAMVIVTHDIQEAAGLGRKIFIMAGAPGAIVSCVENPSAGRKDYRDTEEFYIVCERVRRELERVA
ncbi:MAG: ABC transporter ATP-binding protein [Desulfomonilaceae bacterium]